MAVKGLNKKYTIFIDKKNSFPSKIIDLSIKKNEVKKTRDAKKEEI